jgi:hypothetical protein
MIFLAVDIYPSQRDTGIDPVEVERRTATCVSPKPILKISVEYAPTAILALVAVTAEPPVAT